MYRAKGAGNVRPWLWVTLDKDPSCFLKEQIEHNDLLNFPKALSSVSKQLSANREKQIGLTT